MLFFAASLLSYILCSIVLDIYIFFSDSNLSAKKLAVLEHAINAHPSIFYHNIKQQSTIVKSDIGDSLKNAILGLVHI